MKKMILVIAVLGLCGTAEWAQGREQSPEPSWEDMGVLHLYNASCPKGYTYQAYKGAVYPEAQLEEYAPQITATEYPANVPAGTCTKEQP